MVFLGPALRGIIYRRRGFVVRGGLLVRGVGGSVRFLGGMEVAGAATGMDQPGGRGAGRV